MDARALLDAVAQAYSRLETLAVEVLTTNESGGVGELNRNEQRASAYYVAPDCVRIQPAGRRGLTIVTDGREVHTYFGAGKRYSKVGATTGGWLPGEFQPEYPIGSGAIFLFQRIAERVTAAEYVREEGTAHVLSVTYEPPPCGTISCSAVLLWVDTATHLISRLEGSVTHRMPAHDEEHTNKIEVTLTAAIVNRPIPAETFTYTPPADAVEMVGGRVGFGGGGGGGGSSGRGTAGAFETWTQHEWAGETMIERSKLRLYGATIAIERRLKRSADAKAVHVTEIITGPQGTSEREFEIPL
jgi:hypothetical protein